LRGGRTWTAALSESAVPAPCGGGGGGACMGSDDGAEEQRRTPLGASGSSESSAQGKPSRAQRPACGVTRVAACGAATHRRQYYPPS
jgi:hypothetical protein